MIKNYITINKISDTDKLELCIYKIIKDSEYDEVKLINRLHINSKYELLNYIEELQYGDTAIIKDYDSIKILLKKDSRLYNMKHILITRSINQGYRVSYNTGKESENKKHIELLDTSIDRILYYNDKLKE